MKRRAIIHIGTEKTGSTAIQVMLAKGRGALRRQGVYFPRLLGGKKQLALTMYAMPKLLLGPLTPNWEKHTRDGTGRPIAETPAALDDELSALPDRIDRVILSDELLHSRLVTVEAVRRFKALLDPHFDSFDVIVYLRRQDDLAVSLYSTLLSVGNTRESVLPDLATLSSNQIALDAALAAGADGPWIIASATRGYFDYAAMLERWAAVFGADAMKPRLYAAAAERGLLKDMLSACGLVDDGLTAIPGQNAPMKPEAQEMLRRFNLTLGTASRRYASLAKALHERFPGEGRLPSRAEARAFVDHFAASNEAVRQKWFPERETLFSDSFGRYPPLADPLPNAEAMLAVALAVLRPILEAEEQARADET